MDLFMAYDIEKRRYRRFKVPGAEVKFKKRGLLFWVQAFSEPCPVINVSKGGMAFTCDKKLSDGKKLVVQLLIPDETPLNLNCITRGQAKIMSSGKRFTKVEFIFFGNRHEWNAQESLDVLRKNWEKYGSKLIDEFI
jgi:hypothetical protein